MDIRRDITEEPQCVICIEDLRPEPPAEQLPTVFFPGCAHEFHAECLWGHFRAILPEVKKFRDHNVRIGEHEYREIQCPLCRHDLLADTDYKSHKAFLTTLACDYGSERADEFIEMIDNVFDDSAGEELDDDVYYDYGLPPILEYPYVDDDRHETGPIPVTIEKIFRVVRQIFKAVADAALFIIEKALQLPQFVTHKVNMRPVQLLTIVLIAACILLI